MKNREPFVDASDESIVASLAIFARELLRRESRRLLTGNGIPEQHVAKPLPVSRAAAADFVRMIELWVADRAGVPVAAPPRTCPACRSAVSDFQFLSFDLYPYHSCRTCGTWFVPQVIDDGVFEAYYARVPEARRISEAMMAGRDERTRDSDRGRFGHYFELLRPLIGDAAPRYLDIGCGVGHSVELASELGWDARGEELSDVAVATAKAKGRNVGHPGTSQPGATYDVVSMFETLEHITDPDQVLADAMRALAPLGIVVITVPNRSSFEVSVLRERCFHVFGGYEHVGHINLFDPRGLSALLERHGLSLMFTDGQFSSDLAQIFSHLTTNGQSVLSVIEKGQMEFAVPESAYTVLNNLGPASACLERALKRSPILIALACRTAARPQLAPAFATLEQRWHAEVEATLAAEGEALAASEDEYKATVAAMQGEIQIREDAIKLREDAIKLREEMNRTLETHLQAEIQKRDRMLEELRDKFNRTVGARMRSLIRALVRR